MANARILLVEDEETIRDAVVLNLELEGYEVVAKSDGAAGEETALSGKFDLIILDLMLPLRDGFSIAQSIRRVNQQVPILMLTARDATQDKIRGLKIGADDYLTKPFDLEEFLLRVANLLKRSSSAVADKLDSIEIGENRIHFKSQSALNYRAEAIDLTKKEADLLKLLWNRKNEVVSRNEILDTVWGVDKYPSARTIDNLIVNFRKYFEENPREPKFLFSVRGVGYRLVVE